MSENASTNSSENVIENPKDPNENPVLEEMFAMAIQYTIYLKSVLNLN